MDLVARASVPTNLKTKDSAAAWAAERLKSTGYRVDRQGYGEIYFSKKDMDKGLRYADTAEEKAALAVLPQVLKRGIEIGDHANHKNMVKQTVTFAAPVELNGTRGNMAVVVNRNGSHYYAHRIVMPDGSVFRFSGNAENAAQELSRGVTVSGSLADTTSAASTDSIRSPEPKSQEKFSAAEDVAESDASAEGAAAFTLDSIPKKAQDYLRRVHGQTAAAAAAVPPAARLTFMLLSTSGSLKESEDFKMDRKMFCFQCEQTAGGTGCMGKAGVCGKSADVAKLQDELTGALVGLARATDNAPGVNDGTWRLMIEGLFTTVTNVCFNEKALRR